MKRRRVEYSRASEQDAADIMDLIESAAGEARARAYVARIRNFCDQWEYGAERGSRHDKILLGLRVIGFERRVSVMFTVEDDRVTILRLFYGGRDGTRVVK